MSDERRPPMMGVVVLGGPGRPLEVEDLAERARGIGAPAAQRTTLYGTLGEELARLRRENADLRRQVLERSSGQGFAEGKAQALGARVTEIEAQVALERMAREDVTNWAIWTARRHKGFPCLCATKPHRCKFCLTPELFE